MFSLKKIFLLWLCLYFAVNTAYAGQALPVTPMQNAISGAIQQKAIKRGFAANDPRFGATLDLVSGGFASAAGAGAAVIVAGAITAPAWVTVAIAAGVGAVVTAAVTLGINGVVDWLFSPSSTDAKPITYRVSQQTPQGPGMVAGGPYWRDGFNLVSGGDAMSVIKTAIPINWPDTSTSTYKVGACNTQTATYVSCSVTRVNKADGYNQVGYAAIGANYFPSGAPGSCQPGFVYRQAACVAVPIAPDPKVSAQEAVNYLTQSPAELAKPLNPSIIASIADKAWRDAASQPGYSGLPYVATDPVTTAEVDAWLQAHPQSWPTVQDFVAPQPAANSPWKLPGNPTATTQDPTQATTPSTNPGQASPVQNLGPDPGIGAPILEPTPTARQILQPLFDLLPDFRSFVVPSHQAVCPKPSFSLFGQTIVMESHCTIAEDQRAALYAVMAAVWVLAGAIIVLKA